MTKKRKPYTSYTREFKQEAVRLMEAPDRPAAEIARELVVSKRTIESHISSIRSKLGFTERTQIVRWAYETGLGDLPG